MVEHRVAFTRRVNRLNGCVGEQWYTGMAVVGVKECRVMPLVSNPAYQGVQGHAREATACWSWCGSWTVEVGAVIRVTRVEVRRFGGLLLQNH